LSFTITDCSCRLFLFILLSVHSVVGCSDTYDYGNVPDADGSSCDDDCESMNCFDHDVWCYDSCGKRDHRYQSCTYGCSGGSCLPKPNEPDDLCETTCISYECGYHSGCACGQCPSGKSCSSDGRCLDNCQDECEKGERGCVNYTTFWSCKVVDGCFQQVETYCKSGERCRSLGYCGEDCAEGGEGCNYDQDCCRYDKSMVVYGTGACVGGEFCKDDRYKCVTPSKACDKNGDCCGYFNEDGPMAYCATIENYAARCWRTCVDNDDCYTGECCLKLNSGKKVCVYKSLGVCN